MELFDIGAERAVLAGLLQYGDEAYVEISGILDENSFGDNNNQVVFKCLRSIIEDERKVDLPSIIAAAEKLNLTESISTEQEIKYINSLKTFYIEPENVFQFAVQIKKYEFARSIKRTLNQVSHRIDNITGEESVDEIISLLEDPVSEFLREDTGGDKPEILGENIFEYLQFLEDNQCDIVGIPTGYKRWDEAIGGGLRRGCVDLIGARSKTGKSMFADGAAANITRTGIPVLMLDTEMGNTDHIHRILGALSEVETKEIEKGTFANDPDKKERVYEAAKELEGLPYHYINVSGKPFENVINIIKRWVTHHVKVDENGKTNDCVIIYDYLKLTTSSDIGKNMQEYQALGFQATQLHNTCVKLDVPCLSFVQLNRDGLTKESEDAVSGSDRLIWLCTSFSIFKIKSVEEIAEDGPRAGNRKLIPIVARHGPCLTDGDYINMNLYGNKGKLVEINSRNEMRASDQGLIDNDTLEEFGRSEHGNDQSREG